VAFLHTSFVTTKSVVEQLCNSVTEATEAGARLTALPVVQIDEGIAEEVRHLAREVEVVVFSQGSMARVLPLLSDLPVPLYTSPRLAVERVKDLLTRGPDRTIVTGPNVDEAILALEAASNQEVLKVVLVP
jgi:hypothetical protein